MVEITEYEGKDLSSVQGFQENSIKGPRYVDIEEYQLDITGLVAKPASYNYEEVIDGYDHYKKLAGLRKAGAGLLTSLPSSC